MNMLLVYWMASFFGVFEMIMEVSCHSIYDNYTLVRLYPQNIVQMAALHYMVESDGGMTILKKSRALNDSFDILLPTNMRRSVTDMAVLFQIDYKTKEKYGSYIESVKQISRVSNFSIYEYHSFDNIMDYLSKLASKYPERVQMHDVGKSYQGRPMLLMHISANPTAGNPIIFVDAGMHAREWVSTALALYAIERLVEGPQSAVPELDGVDWYIMPATNPDGYEFSRSNKDNRMWRKTRSENKGCIGVDSNRNFGYVWASSGMSHNPCDLEVYCGPEAFSEREAQAVRDVMLNADRRIKLYLNLHSYGNYLIHPWGYTKKLPWNYKQHYAMGKNASAKIVKAGGPSIKVLSSAEWYTTSGTSIDYALGAANIPYSFAFELTDDHEFMFPTNLLLTALPQYYEAFISFAEQIRDEFGYRHKV